MPGPKNASSVDIQSPGGLRTLRRRRQSKFDPRPIARNSSLLSLHEHATDIHLDIHLGYRPLAH
jgi:hypothetical protein